MSKAPFKPPIKEIKEILEAYDENYTAIGVFMKSIVDIMSSTPNVMKNVHSIRSRMKDRTHLREKLIRKARELNEEGKPFPYNPENLLTTINDLAGIRILHLYTRQFGEINSSLRKMFEDYRIVVKEGPFARTWDDESRDYFKSLGVETQESRNMYTSVHYVVESYSATTITCELQVRTLMEEVWGEVDHQINYPEKTPYLPCHEQIRALARATSSATRLVDAIFATNNFMATLGKKK